MDRAVSESGHQCPVRDILESAENPISIDNLNTYGFRHVPCSLIPETKGEFMQIRSSILPARPRPRTVVHAGPLVLRRPRGRSLLERYLRAPRKREVFLLHSGQDELREAAKYAGVVDIALDTPAKHEATEAAEVAIALGARRIDFTIDEPRIVTPDGEERHELSLIEAEALSHNPRVRPRIRAKLRAGCSALRRGMRHVRIGAPEALIDDCATELRTESHAGVGALRDPAAADSDRAQPDVEPGRPPKSPCIPDVEIPLVA